MDPREHMEIVYFMIELNLRTMRSDTNSLSVYFPVVCQQDLVYHECRGILMIQGK